MFRKAFPWLNQDLEELPNVELRGDKVLIREKTIEDIPDEYEWRVDDELSRLDATRPLSMSYESFLTYSKVETTEPPSGVSTGVAFSSGRSVYSREKAQEVLNSSAIPPPTT